MKQIEFQLQNILQFNSTTSNEGKRLSIQDTHDKELLAVILKGNILTSDFKTEFLSFLKSNNYGFLTKNATNQYSSYSLNNAQLSYFITGRSMFYFTTIMNAKVNDIFIRPVIIIICALGDTAKQINELFKASRIISKVAYIVQFISFKACCELRNYLNNFLLKMKYAEQVWFSSGIT